MEGPSAFNVEMPQTMKVITIDRMKGMTMPAYRAGSLQRGRETSVGDMENELSGQAVSLGEALSASIGATPRWMRCLT